LNENRVSTTKKEIIMPNLQSKYLGVELKNPIIAGASTMTKNVDAIKRLEDAGAAAVVTASLFEEEIQLERFKFEEDLTQFDGIHSEMTEIFPKLEHAGPEEHLSWIRKTKENISIPVFGSLNAVNIDTLEDYAKKMEQTGVDAIELNLYRFPYQSEKSAEEIEKEQAEQLKKLLGSVTVPVAVKLSPFYTNPLNFVKRLDTNGVKGFVLFNRLFQPDIDIKEEKINFPFNLSNPEDRRLPLRYTGLLYGELNGDICSSTGIMSGDDIIKMILAGATCIQTVTSLFKNGIGSISTMLEAIDNWMNEKGYGAIDDFRGKLSRKNIDNPGVYKRAQYVKLLLRPEILER